MSTFWDIFGAILSIVGFTIVIIDTRKSKTEIKKARKEIFTNNASNDLSNVISSLDEIKRSHRSTHNVFLLELYSDLRKSIISIKNLYPNLSRGHQTILQRALQFCSDMEKMWR
jgi:hypothetical protein